MEKGIEWRRRDGGEEIVEVVRLEEGRVEEREWSGFYLGEAVGTFLPTPPCTCNEISVRMKFTQQSVYLFYSTHQQFIPNYYQ